MPSNKEKRAEQQKRRREAPLEAPVNEAPKVKPRCYTLSDGQIHNPSRVPEAIIPERVKIEFSKVTGCTIPKHEFIKILEGAGGYEHMSEEEMREFS